MKKIKKFGFYTLHKGKRFAQIIEKKWEENQKKEMETTLAELTRVYEDFVTHYNHEELAKNYYLSVLNKGCDEESQQVLVNILDYVSMVFDKPTHFNPELIKQADSVKGLLIALSLDKNYSNIRENLSSLAKKSVSLIDSHHLLIALAGELSNEINSLSLDAVHQRLNGALTIEELQMLPYVELIKLPEDKRTILIENIQSERLSYFGSSTNLFLEHLVGLIGTKGVSLTEFANLSLYDQTGFLWLHEQIMLFVQNGIPFKKLIRLETHELINVIEKVENSRRFFLLSEIGNSAQKLKLIDDINTMIDEKTVYTEQRIEYDMDLDKPVNQQTTAGNLAKSMASVFGSQQSEVKTISIDVVFKRLNGALTISNNRRMNFN